MQNGTADTNVPDGAIRFNGQTNKFEKYNITTPGWEALVVNVDYTDYAGAANSAGGTALNATSLGGFPASSYLRSDTSDEFNGDELLLNAFAGGRIRSIDGGLIFSATGTGTVTIDGAGGANLTSTQNDVKVESLLGDVNIEAPDPAGSINLTSPSINLVGNVTIDGGSPVVGVNGWATGLAVDQNILETLTTVQFRTTVDGVDFGGNFNNTTHKAKPTVAGWYQINAIVSFREADYITQGRNLKMGVHIGTEAVCIVIQSPHNPLGSCTLSRLAYFNGTTDECYIDISTNQESNGVTYRGGCWFSGFLVLSD
jgi:hypothetical protein